MTHKLKKIPYEYDALEPYIDKETMKIHHTKHHQTYVDKLNESLKNNPELMDSDIKELMKNIDDLPKDLKQKVIFFGGGVINHDLFWKILKKDVDFAGKIKDKIVSDFDSYDNFQEKFTEKAMTLQGSGWTWLVLNEGKLEIINTNNQDSPLLFKKMPLLGLDMWEHAYYLKYQNKKKDYIDNFFKIINWENVNDNYKRNIH